METEDLIIVGAISIALFGSLLVVLQKTPRSGGTDVKFHVAFVVVASLFLFFVPEFIQNNIFSPGGVLIVGTLIPVYESTKAVMSPGRDDDLSWLQFWVASGSFTYCTEWMDVVAENYPEVAEHWYEAEFLSLLWLLLPFTDGSTLMFNLVTAPLLAPIAKTIKKKAEGKMSIISIIVNALYLWGMWFTFLVLDEEAKRFIVIAVGTIYPISASMVACTRTGLSKFVVKDDTFWLTYWICFSILFIMMDYLETFVGSIKGFYSICLCATIYLFLPLFKGAEVVFRKIIVPLSGQHEQMFLKDIDDLKEDILSKIPRERRGSVLSKAAALFDKDKDE